MNKKNNTFLDFATLISICGIALYILGWLYWNYFFKNLNISLSFFDLSFDKVISTTWPFIILSVMGFIPIFVQITGEEIKSWDIMTAVFIVVNGLLLSLFYLLKFDYYLWIFISTSSIYFIVRYFMLRKKVRLYFISVQSIKYVFLITIYVFGIFLYGYTGKKDALSLIENYQEDCRIVLKNKDEITGKFIIHNGNKIFIISELYNCKKEVVIINDDEILQFITTLK
ncbi:conserved membrane hypothetical protein [Flavobacterium sp. 9R]|uniref:hypothetical protein n=1 Tax=Flavobacterium sp. 9R TaxID=2653143 RepID=UPI0012F0CD10|nr:hypothetical protein [Flavobacterium sp. 9R]VXB74532.1 conserved membrane hypothetical protein [Flavobacterium sp. 9R]